MTGRHQIRALGRKGGGDKQADLAADGAVGEDLTMLGEGDLELPESWLDPDSEPALPAIRFGWLAPGTAILAVAGWSGFFGWAYSAAMLSGAAPSVWATWAVQWSVPVALIGIIWLLAMRSSRAEGNRFAASAALMSA